MATTPVIQATGLSRALPDSNPPRKYRPAMSAGTFPPTKRPLILSALDLTVEAGEALAIVGPSGTGKSTLVHIFNGLLRPDAGTLLVFGEDTATHGDDDWARWRRTQIATVFQDANLIPTLTLRRNVAFRSSLAGCSDPAREAAVMDALGIADLGERYPDQVSGGERQRGAIAAAFAMRPRLLLADEPTGSLDEASTRRVAKLFFAGIRERGLTAVIATHNLTLAAQCDRILELSGGTLHPLTHSVVAAQR